MSSDESDIEESLEKLKLDDKYINILLLGETGVGKSTFINSLGNYFSLKYFDNAADNGVSVVIPTTFEIKDKNNKTIKMKLGKKIKDTNECLEAGESATQSVRTYVFPLWKGRINVRLIDTPGMGDTRGIAQDEKNCGNILDYLKTLEKIHAICFLFKPTQARETVFFKYCLHQLLSRFDKTACKNIFFLFTNTRGSDYTPGETLRILEKIVQNIQEKAEDVRISTDKNVYCFDNEALKYLAAVEKKVEFSSSIREVFYNSWKISAKNAHSLVTQLQRGSPTAYSTDELISINFARKTLSFFSKQLAKISQTMQDNLRILSRLQGNRTADKNEIAELQKTKTKSIDVEKTPVCQPINVCTDRKCADVFWVNDVPKWHYKKVCHGTCVEVSNVRKEIVGCPELLNCQVISQTTRKCRQCGCDYSLHMHVDYITRIKETYVLDEKVLKTIAVKENNLDNLMEIIDDISINNVELKSEYDAIQTFSCGLASGLHKNAIVSFSSSFKEYIVYLINQKNSLGDSTANKSSIDELEKLKKQFEETENIFEETLKNPEQDVINLQNFDQRVQKLFLLKENGGEIRKFCDSLKNPPENPSSVKEYVHPHYYEGDYDDVRKGPRNKNISDQRRNGKQDADDRGRRYPDRHNGNEDRNRKERDTRNRNDRYSNRGYHPNSSFNPPPPHYNQPPPYQYHGQPYHPPQGHPPYYPKPTPYQRPAPSGQPARGANYGRRNQPPRQNDGRYDHSQRGDQYRRGSSDRRGNDNSRERIGPRLAKPRYRRVNSRKNGDDSEDDSDESVASSKH